MTPATQLSDEEVEVVKVLAVFMGWQWEPITGGWHIYPPIGHRLQFTRPLVGRELTDWLPMDLLTSRDAIAPVLAKLSDREKAYLETDCLRFIYDKAARVGQFPNVAVLSLSTPTLARAVAESIVKAKECPATK